MASYAYSARMLLWVGVGVSRGRDVVAHAVNVDTGTGTRGCAITTVLDTYSRQPHTPPP